MVMAVGVSLASYLQDYTSYVHRTPNLVMSVPSSPELILYRAQLHDCISETRNVLVPNSIRRRSLSLNNPLDCQHNVFRVRFYHHVLSRLLLGNCGSLCTITGTKELSETTSRTKSEAELTICALTQANVHPYDH